ncbi:uncharacterized protein LOC109608724 [Aethina tumida]|uniref:uncharacterized protein LOC109608724 n=1 Tax=Aethina tumida TaxID=116153 RepID=UPI002149819A|nr:uncharacterized protein LOC109608724 [Aethina tumida]
MMGNSVFLLFAFLLTCASFEATEVLRDCVKQDACHCKIDDYERIDISNALDKSPLKDQDSEFTYYFVGCADATINSTIFNSTLTKNYTGSLFVYNGKNNTIEALRTNQINFETNQKLNVYEITYKNKSNVSASISLICNNFKKAFIKVLDVENNQLVLSSPHACVLKEKHSYSTGSVLVILFVVACLIYFVGGALVLHFLRGAQGLEMIPNIDFWRQLPGLIKDGTIFIFSGCRPTYVNTAETYDRI